MFLFLMRIPQRMMVSIFGVSMALFGVCYFILFYWTFQMRFSLVEFTSLAAVLTKKNVALELDVRRQETALGTSENDEIKDMVKVSKIR